MIAKKTAPASRTTEQLIATLVTAIDAGNPMVEALRIFISNVEMPHHFYRWTLTAQGFVFGGAASTINETLEAIEDASEGLEEISVSIRVLQDLTAR